MIVVINRGGELLPTELDQRAPRPDPSVQIPQHQVERELPDEPRQDPVHRAQRGHQPIEPPLPRGIPRQPHLVAKPLRQESGGDQQGKLSDSRRSRPGRAIPRMRATAIGYR